MVRSPIRDTARRAQSSPAAWPAEWEEEPEVSVVLPVYQEHAVVRPVIQQLIQTLEASGRSFEIVAVDDGSTDGTVQVLEAAAAEYPGQVRSVRHPYNKGNGAAIKTGIRSARGQIIVCMDADGQHDPDDLGRMLPLMADYDLVIGTRPARDGGTWHRSLANRFYNGLASWLTEFPIEDLTSGYRVFRASVVRRYVSLFPARFSYPTTSTLVFLKGGYNVKFVPIHIRPRQGGASKIRILRDGWHFVIIILKIVMLFEPLRLFLPIGVLSFALATLSSLLDSWYLQTWHVPNSSVLLFVLGVLVLLLGFLSEQITAVQVSLRDDVERAARRSEGE